MLQNPALRAVPFELACAYAAENLDEDGLGGQDLSCHEVSAKDDTGNDTVPPNLGTALTPGVEEVFLAISRKLVEQREEIEEARETLMHGRRQFTSVHADDSPRQRSGCTC